MSIILCGFKNCGKSSAGKLLADNIHAKFVDTDDLIEQRFCERSGSKKDTRAIFKTMGERGFRNLEREVIGDIQSGELMVIATGGGVVMDAASTAHLKSLGTLVYMKLPADELYTRMRKSHLLPGFIDPKAPRQSFDVYYNRRAATYEQVADAIVETIGLSAAQIAKALEGLCPTKKRTTAGATHGQ